MREYQIDLFARRDIHFYKFCLMLAFLPEGSTFGQKIAIRTYDLSGLSGKELRQMSAAKDRVQLPEILSLEQAKEQEEFRAFWERF